MILYHGSNQIVKKPKILTPNRYLDFGNGFYTTSNLEQAENFASKVVARTGEGESIVNVYEFDERKLKSLKVLKFETADERWLDFVSANRNGVMKKNDYDLICGPVANDDIFRTFVLYSTGVLSKEQTLEALKVKKLFDQYVFTSESALKYLKYVEAEENK